MKKLYIKLAGAMLTLMGVLAPTTVSAQCGNNNTLWATVGNINPGQTVTVSGTWGGEYNTFNCVSGSTYVISTCNGGSWDSQLTLYNNTGGSSLAYNDDFCGLQSQITWTATFNGTVRVLLDQYNCSSNTSSMTMTITRNGGGGVNCWDGNITGTGSVSASTCNAGNESALRPSTDRIYRVQIQQAGCYNFSLCGSSAFWDSYMFLTTACPGNTVNGGTVLASSDDGCGSFAGHGVISNVNLAAGTYFLTVEGFGSSDCGNFTLNVTSGSAPVAGAISAPAAFGCGSSATFSVPFQSGVTYNWSTTNGSVISGQGTNAVTIAWGSGSGTVSVVPSSACGTGASVSTTVSCVNPPANDLCANAPVFTGNSQSFSNVFATGTDISSCGFNDFNDVWYRWTAPSCGQVTFSTVCGANWDTHLSLYTGCGGTQLACNDDAFDYSCGTGLTSRITANVTAGQTYLLRVAGYNGAQGTGTVSMSMSSPLSVTATAGSIACFGGSTAVNVSANGGSGVYSGTGSYTVGAGTYNYTVTDSYGCSASTSITVSEPTKVNISASNTAILCNGGTSDVTVNTWGGTTPYSVNDAGNYTVTAGSYTYNVTDANGCSASTSLSITEPTAVVASASATPILCNGGTSAITVSGQGGTGALNGTGTFTVTAGTYSYTVTDANGCTDEVTITVTEPTQLTSSLSAVSYNGYGVSCFGSTNGEVTVSAGGGTSPYSGTGV